MDKSTIIAPDSLDTLLVAHRGEPVRFPENTLYGFRAALEAGARYVETDIQFTADGVAVLSHDLSLLRLTGHRVIIPQSTFSRLHTLTANEPKRFGPRFSELRVTTLDAFVDLLMEWPEVHAFIEIKVESFSVFGSLMVQRILEQIEPIASRSTLISTSSQALESISALGGTSIGWVLPAWTLDTCSEAERLRPDVLFINHKRLPANQSLWPGEWRWAVYTLNRLPDIARFIRRGFHLFETNNISALLQAARQQDGDPPVRQPRL